ncbi:hypothetical protein EAH68_09845 [Corynebacterium hylobatis]|uniref:Uncharacterized protein n=1 Tax=Corynebacterium hylobatis TaxID=1859290 RepID=A0A3S0C0K5_9CORY|nr:hypothetical protein [Corynebacterium hylobatis]RSZ62430.1 hypothetical protein EAH68_09845 [Corynebacterium hylobatis]
MHYTSWDRTDTDAPVLLAEGGPAELGRFTADAATVDGQVWGLSFTKETGARATLADGRVLDAPGNFGRDKTITVDVAGTKYSLINEASTNWIIEDAAGEKIGQFSGAGNGVRQSILEFEGETDLPVETVAGLSWLVRLVLESRLGRSSLVLIGTLIIMSVIAVLAFIF